MHAKKAYFHLPGLFEFYDFYEMFLPLFYSHREYFYDWCEIGSIYGAPEDMVWGGGREGVGEVPAKKVLTLLNRFDISARLTFSNSLLEEKHLEDEKCNALCKAFSEASCGQPKKHGVIVHSDLLRDYISKTYPKLYLVSSTTKVIIDVLKLNEELSNKKYSYVVLDFRLNKAFDVLRALSQEKKDKTEFLVNECCFFGCKDRKACYEAVSRKNLGENVFFRCKAYEKNEGYHFSKAMENPGFLSNTQIPDIYLPMGFSQFKIEGRTLGSALLLEFILYYMTKPAYHIHVREALYLDNELDLF